MIRTSQIECIVWSLSVALGIDLDRQIERERGRCWSTRGVSLMCVGHDGTDENTLLMN